MESNFEKVKYFNKTFCSVINDNYDPSIFSTNKEIIKCKLELIKEEIHELSEGINKRDFIEMLDAVLDILYVVYGFGCAVGINLDLEFSNKYKSPLICKTNFDIVKFFHHGDTPCLNFYDINSKNESLNSFVENMQPDDPILVMFNILLNKLQDYYELLVLICSDLYKNNKYNMLASTLVDLLSESYKFGLCLGLVHINEAFGIVHEANMSKICKTEEDAIKTVAKYKSDAEKDPNYPYLYPDYRLTHDSKMYIVYNNDQSENAKYAGKILKSIYWKEPNFEDFFSSLR